MIIVIPDIDIEDEDCYIEEMIIAKKDRVILSINIKQNFIQYINLLYDEIDL